MRSEMIVKVVWIIEAKIWSGKFFEASTIANYYQIQQQ